MLRTLFACQAFEFAKEAAKTGEPEPLGLLALLYWEVRGRPREALQCVDAALERDPDHVRAIATKAKLLCYVGLLASFSKRLDSWSCECWQASCVAAGHSQGMAWQRFLARPFMSRL